MTATDRTWRGAVRVYVRPEALYVVREDRAATGLILGSAADSARVEWGRPEKLGAGVRSMIERSIDGVEQPSRQSELTAHGRAFRQPLLDSAGLDSWEHFVSETMLISVRRLANSSFLLSPMLSRPDRSWGFVPTGDIVEVEESRGTAALGEMIETVASRTGFGPASS